MLLGCLAVLGPVGIYTGGWPPDMIIGLIGRTGTGRAKAATREAMSLGDRGEGVGDMSGWVDDGPLHTHRWVLTPASRALGWPLARLMTSYRHGRADPHIPSLH